MIRKLILLFGFLIIFQFLKSQTSYSFFVAGHTYGNPGTQSLGLFYQFVDLFPYIQSRQEIKFGVLTGDIVKHPSSDAWDSVDNDVLNLGLPVYFAVGNHDMYDRQLFENRYGATYFYFVYNDDLFIVLDPNLDHWNISSDQIDMINEALELNSGKINNIFVFFHQVLWWSPENIYKNIVVNSTEGRAGSINFWTDIEPIFNGLANQVYMFAGDIGATNAASNIMYDHYSNITFIASGMGNHIDDNFVIVNIDTLKKVTFDLISLDSNDLHCLGNIEDYDYYPNIANKDFVENFYPNPFTDNLYFSLKGVSFLKIFNFIGECVFQKEINSYSAKLNLGYLPKGVYFFEFYNANKRYVVKAMKQ